MKPLLLLLSFFFPVFLFAQPTIDFETVGNDYTWTVFGNTTGDSTNLSLVENPSMTGINTSDSVMKFIVAENATVFAGAFTPSITPFTLDANNSMITVMVYKDVISDFNLKLEPPNVDHRVPNTVINQWEKITFDYSADIGANVTTLTIIPDHVDTRTVGSISYFDNIVFIPDVIPVELTGFSASVVGNGVDLKWTTASELNNIGFDIERRNEGATSFVKVGFVQGRGTTTDVSSYNFLDQNASGKLYYRLKQTDQDGSFDFSNTIEVDATKLIKFELAQNYPNPFNPGTTISYSIPQNSFVTIKVFDVLGNEVAVLLNDEVESGIHHVNFNATNLSSGVYYYSINAGSFTSTKKLILMK
jgi:hypothetical protein